jgi:hypothetical protein
MMQGKRIDGRHAGWLARGAVLALVVSAALGAMVAPAAASDKFTCRASVLKLQRFEPYRANAQDDPCVADEEGMSGRRFVKNGLAVEGITSARTERRGGAPRNRAVSGHSEVADLEYRRAGKPSLLHAKGITSYARVDCSAGSPKLTGITHIVGLKVNGRTITAGSKPLRLELGPWTLYVNRTVYRRHEVVVRPLELDRSGKAFLKVAASRAGYTGHPCGR